MSLCRALHTGTSNLILPQTTIRDVELVNVQSTSHRSVHFCCKVAQLRIKSTDVSIDVTLTVFMPKK